MGWVNVATHLTLTANTPTNYRLQFFKWRQWLRDREQNETMRQTIICGTERFAFDYFHFVF